MLTQENSCNSYYLHKMRSRVEGANFRHVSVQEDCELIKGKNHGSISFFIIPNSTSHTVGVKKNKKNVLIELNLHKALKT